MKYKVLYADSLILLETEVGICIDAGWRPQGGVACSNKVWAQAMVRSE